MYGNDTQASRVAARHGRSLALRQQMGLTVIELAMALVVISLMMSLGLVISNLAVGRSESADNVQQMSMMQANVRRFVIANNRVPCPDISGNGLEDCATPANNFGAFPYRATGLSGPLLDSRGQPLLYGASPDLQQPAATPMAPWDFPSGSLDRFCATLQARLTDGFRANELTVATRSGSCNEADGAFNPAVAMLTSGLENRDGGGTLWDGALNPTAAAGAGLCIENPGRPLSARYDDQVRAVGLSEFYGQMCLRGRDSFDATLWD